MMSGPRAGTSEPAWVGSSGTRGPQSSSCYFIPQTFYQSLDILNCDFWQTLFFLPLQYFEILNLIHQWFYEWGHLSSFKKKIFKFPQIFKQEVLGPLQLVSERWFCIGLHYYWPREAHEATPSVCKFYSSAFYLKHELFWQHASMK